jgi:ribose transport system substrate-binding protein
MRMKSSAKGVGGCRALLVLGAVMLVAACGSSDGDSGGDSGNGGGTVDQAGLAEAKAYVEQALVRPTTLPVTQPVGKPIPEGKNIDFVVCPAPACSQFVTYFTEAADVLGWNVKEVTSGSSAGDIQAAWDQVIRDAPDAVVYSSLSRAQFEPQLAQLDEMGIPVLTCCTDDDAGGAVKQVQSTSEDQEPEPLMLAAYPIADSEGRANSLLLSIPAFSILEEHKKVFFPAYEKWCPTCTVDELAIPVQNIGKDVPNQVVSYLRAHPDVNYILAQQDVLALGLPAALRAAGLEDQVKIVGMTPDAQNLQMIENGEEAATVGFPIYEQSWMWADALARYFTDQSMDPSSEPLPFQLLTKDNLNSSTEVTPLIEDYQEQFKTLWGK